MTAISRRLVVSGALAALGVSVAKSEELRKEGCDDEFRTASSQFVRLEPVQSLPDFGLQRLDGRWVGFADFHGRLVLLSFWASWCPPCRRELPRLEQLQSMGQTTLSRSSLSQSTLVGAKRQRHFCAN